VIPWLLDELVAPWPALEALDSLLVRTAAAALLAFGVALLIGPRLLAFLHRRQILEVETETDSPELNARNALKTPTPTMGGLIVLGALLVSGVVFGDLANAYVRLALLGTIGFGMIGTMDDWVKLSRPQRRGLPAAVKFLLQFLVAISLSFAVTLLYRERSQTELLALYLPFTDGATLDLSALGGVPHMLLTFLVVSGTSNAVNLTDGVDGLAPGAMVVAAATFAGICVLVGRAHALEIDLVYVPDSQELAVFCGAMAGATLGFLWFNAAPALVYMGDTGSLPLGSLLGFVAVVTKQELVLVVVGGVFVIEALSVVLQVLHFKATGGRRLFRCAPLHHHYQFAGMPDTRLTVRLWIVAALFAAAGLAVLTVG